MGMPSHFVGHSFSRWVSAVPFCVSLNLLPHFFLVFPRMVWLMDLRPRGVQLLWQLGSGISRERGRGKVPSALTITRWAEAFQHSGTMLGHQQHRRPRRLTPAVLRALRRAIRRNPRLSVRRLAARTGIPRATVHRAIRHQLGLFPYKLQLVQRLHRGDKAKRLQFCHWLLSKWKLLSFCKGLITTD